MEKLCDDCLPPPLSSLSPPADPSVQGRGGGDTDSLGTDLEIGNYNPPTILINYLIYIFFGGRGELQFITDWQIYLCCFIYSPSSESTVCRTCKIINKEQQQV